MMESIKCMIENKKKLAIIKKPIFTPETQTPVVANTVSGNPGHIHEL